MYAVRPLAEQEISVADLVLQVIAMKELSNGSRPNSANTTITLQTTSIAHKSKTGHLAWYYSIEWTH